MAKMIHLVIRVLDEQASLDFYRQAFGLHVAHRHDFENLTIVYLANAETTFELELTINKGRSTPYEHGEAFGHFSFAVDDVDAEHARLTAEGREPGPLKEFAHEGRVLSRFFFVSDPDGYKIAVLQRNDRYL